MTYTWMLDTTHGTQLHKYFIAARHSYLKAKCEFGELYF